MKKYYILLSIIILTLTILIVLLFSIKNAEQVPEEGNTKRVVKVEMEGSSKLSNEVELEENEASLSAEEIEYLKRFIALDESDMVYHESDEMEGDIGIIAGNETIDTLLEIPKKNRTKEYLQSLCRTYNGYIPFLEYGKEYGEGYDRYTQGIDNRGEVKFGMDSSGYVVWVYRNVFGYTPDGFNDLVVAYQNSYQVSVEDLKIGDIGLLTDIKDSTRNHFGIYIGKDMNGTPIFSHCSNLATSKFPLGTTRLSYLASVKDSYYDGSPSVEFNYFFRPNVEWED